MMHNHFVRAVAPATVAVLAATWFFASAALSAPAIRTGAGNPVPACVSPEKLMRFLSDRNQTVDPRYANIARWYKHWGDAWRVRWDYAFFQMALETNYLKYRQGNGRRGDVHERQNNFAGIGATGGGVPGDRFPDIKTGVHAQIQHLVAYSGERLADPIAPRTQLKQDDIIEQSRRLRRPVTFGDLARRWAADRRYARSIDFVAGQFRDRYCSGATAAAATPARDAPVPQPARRPSSRDFPPPSGLGGPKPLRLAGPDELPWANSGQAVTNPAGTAPPEILAPEIIAPEIIAPASPAETASPPKGANFPVRTIWSRDGETDAAPVPARRPKPQAKPAPAATRAAETKSEPQPETSAAPVDGAPLLPTFRISPTTPQPSRLGGPVAEEQFARPSAPVTAAAPAKPSARFKDIVVTSAPVPETAPCRVLTASYGGKKTLLVRAALNGETRYTALTVLDGFEKSMFDIYTKAHAEGAEIVGEYATREDALADARANCPGG